MRRELNDEEVNKSQDNRVWNGIVLVFGDIIQEFSRQFPRPVPLLSTAHAKRSQETVFLSMKIFPLFSFFNSCAIPYHPPWGGNGNITVTEGCECILCCAVRVLPRYRNAHGLTDLIPLVFIMHCLCCWR